MRGTLNILLKGAGQVMFQDSAITGLLFLLGIAWGALAGGTPAVFLGAVIGLVVSTLTAIWLRVEPESLKAGLFGYNGLLVGAALPTFLAVEPKLWLLICLGSMASTITLMATANVFKTWQGSALTFPFVLVTWVVLFAAYAFADVPISSMSPPAMAQQVTAQSAAPLHTFVFWWDAVSTGIAQVFLIANPITGVIFVVALAVSSRWAAGLAVYGSVIAAATAVFLGAENSSIQSGLYGFSPVLTAIALGSTFYQPSPRVLAFTTLAVVSTVLAQAALGVVMLPLGVVTLTAPFVFTTWVFLLAKGDLTSPAHSEVEEQVL